MGAARASAASEPRERSGVGVPASERVGGLGAKPPGTKDESAVWNRIRTDRVAPVRALPGGAPVLVSGDGEALVSLAASGELTGDTAFRFTGSATDDELAQALATGAPVVITDTNRRRATQVTSNHNLTSYTLPTGGVLDRTPLDLFDRTGTRTLFWDALVGDLGKWRTDIQAAVIALGK